MDVVKSISFQKKKDYWNLEVNKPEFCTNDLSFCKKYPCPTCSAVISAITKASGKKILINNAVNNGNKTTFHLKMEQ